MQKELVTSTSLFCDAAPPIAGATAGVHDGNNKDVILMDSIKHRIGKSAMIEATPNAWSYFWPAEGMMNHVVENTQSLGFKRPDHRRFHVVVPVASLVKFVLDALGEPYFHVRFRERV